MQRNTRMVLILVDGKSSVADLCEKTGNPQLVESALQDLERDGLVVPIIAQDSVWEQSKKLAEEIKAAAINRLSREVKPPEPPLPPLIDPVSVASLPPEPFSVAPQSRFPGQQSFSVAPYSTFGGVPSMAPSITPSVAKADTPKIEPEKRGHWFSRLFGNRRSAKESVEPVVVKRGGRGVYISLPMAALFAVLGFFLLAVLAFFFYPYNSHRTQAEDVLSRLMGQPIRVGNIAASFSPSPAIVLESVQGEAGGGVQARGLRLVPELLSLLGSAPVFSIVEIQSAQLDANALSRLYQALSDALSKGGGVTVHAIRFSDLQADVLGLSLSDLHAEIIAPQAGSHANVVFQSTDRSLKINLKPSAGGFLAEFDAYAWKPAEKSRFRFDSLQGLAFWNGQSVSIRSLDARIFDGALQGELLLAKGASLALSGDLTVKHMNVARLAAAMGYADQFEGELAGSLRFVGEAASWGDVIGASVGEGNFTIQRCVLGGLDLVESVRRGTGTVRGGSTRFEQMTGTMKISGERIRLAELNMNSGLLRSSGYLDIARNSDLSGKLNVEMRGSASVVRMSVIPGGTLKSPVLEGAR
ncbi:MAG: hypothetical protein H6943_08475 [Zoogloeaceae bacterium]|nr:hypothetical protein [Zoogloeaceae bacterium]